MDRYARLHLPYSGSLGSHFPTLPISVIFNTDHRYYVPLRLPNVRLKVVRFSLSFLDTLYRPSLLFVFPPKADSLIGRTLLHQRRDFAHAGFPVTVLLHKETFGSPNFLKAIPCPQLARFRGSITQPAALIHPASDSCFQASPRISLLTCWLNFG